MITDLQYLNFLQRLLADQRGKDSLNLTPWEMDFMAGFGQSNQSLRWITDPRRRSIDAMWRRYGPELNHPHPLDTVTERPRLADADPAGCEYLVRDDGGPLRRCNEPATCQEPGRLRYCAMHGEAVVKAMKFAGKTIRLVNL